MKKRVLVVAQETELRAAIARILQPAGYAVELAADERRARELMAHGPLEAAVVAPRAFGAAGPGLTRELLDTIRNVVVLTDRAEVESLSRSLPGARVLVSEPLNRHELLGCLAQRAAAPITGDESAPTPEVLRLESCTLDLAGHTFVNEGGQEVPLTRAEFALLAAFVRNPGRVLSRDQLRNAVIGRDAEPYDRSIDMLVARLRRKIERDPKRPNLIVTVAGAGYKLAVRPQSIGRAAIGAPQAEGARVPHGAAERRYMTVLSCQIVGITALSAQLDPEDMQAVVRAVHQACAEVVERFGGTQVKVPGDRLLVYFGYPEAREEDAERAVRTGLALIRTISDPGVGLPGTLRLRVGIASGLMVVSDASGLELSGSATGEALYLALQLRSVATSNSVVVAPSTHDLVGHLFDCRELDSIMLEEGLEPVRAWHVIGETVGVGQPEARRQTVLRGLVGRQEELELLCRRWRAACRGAGQVTLLTGEAGIGKSRLALELQERLKVEPQTCLRYRGLPHQTDAPLSAVIGELQGAAGFGPADTPAEKFAKLEALLDGLGIRQAATLIADLLRVPTEERQELAQLTPQKRKERTFSTLLARVEGLAARQAVLVAVEDAQWMDPTSLEFLARLVERISALPVMVLVTARPEFAPPWPDHAHVTTLALTCLGGHDAEALIARIAGGRLPEEVTRQILARTDGVPLFIEELTKTVIESGILRGDGVPSGIAELHSPHAIPKTLHGSLLARLDRLGPGKDIAQIGAVIGREFSYELLRSVVATAEPELAAALDRLVASELVFRRGLPQEATYVFKHALVRDAAYGMLLRAGRQELHARVARALEQGFPDAVETQPELLAHHYREAGNAAKAIGYLLTAAERALWRSALTEGLAQLGQARDLLSSLPDDDERRRQELKLQITLGRALIERYGYTAPAAREAYERARALCDQLNDRAWLPLIILGNGIAAWTGADYRTALAQAHELQSWGAREHDPAAQAAAHHLFGISSMLTGALTEARRHLEEGLAIDRSGSPGRRPSIASSVDGRVTLGMLMYLHHCLFLLGWPAQAEIAARQAMAETPTQLFSLALAQNLTCRKHVLRGDAPAAAAIAATLFRLASEQGYPQFIGSSMVFRGWAAAQTGDPAQGVELCREGLAKLHGIGAHCFRPHYLVLLAECHEKAGHFSGGLKALDEAADVIEQTSERVWEPELYRLKGRLLLRTGAEYEQAEACFARGLAIARSQEARLFELRAATNLAAHYAQQGRSADAFDVLAPIYAWFTEGFDSLDLREASAVLEPLRSSLRACSSAYRRKVRRRRAPQPTPSRM